MTVSGGHAFPRSRKIQHFAARPGWSDSNERLEAFEEAGLSLRPDYDDLQQPVWLIAAPGAVGKSTLAQQLFAATGAIYLNLAVADTVGGHYITGGLVHKKAIESWKAGRTTLVVDALDEARMRVTQQAFEDFLKDAKVEHLFRVVKCQFGYRKTRFRGLLKNIAQLKTLFGLANLYLLHKKLMQPMPQNCAQGA